jgi:hypothetical protein
VHILTSSTENKSKALVCLAAETKLELPECATYLHLTTPDVPIAEYIVQKVTMINMARVRELERAKSHRLEQEHAASQRRKEGRRAALAAAVNTRKVRFADGSSKSSKAGKTTSSSNEMSNGVTRPLPRTTSTPSAESRTKTTLGRSRNQSSANLASHAKGSSTTTLGRKSRTASEAGLADTRKALQVRNPDLHPDPAPD